MAEQSRRQRKRISRYSVGPDKEKNNGVPIAANMPRGMQRPPSLTEMFQAYLKTEQMQKQKMQTTSNPRGTKMFWTSRSMS